MRHWRILLVIRFPSLCWAIQSERKEAGSNRALYGPETPKILRAPSLGSSGRPSNRTFNRDQQQAQGLVQALTIVARRASVERVGLNRITREDGYVYYLGADGYVWRMPNDLDVGWGRTRVGTESIVPEDGYAYFVDRDGFVARALTEPVSKEHVDLEPGYIYYLARDGYVWRVPADLNSNGRPARVGTVNIRPQDGYVYLIDKNGYVVRAPSEEDDDAGGPRSKSTHTVIVREIVKVPCQYCGGLREVTAPTCPFCGAAAK